MNSKLIVGKDRPNASIVVSANASAPVQHAAEELQYFIRQMIGLSLPIVANAGDSPFIAVGKEACSSEISNLPAFGKEDFVIREKNGNLFIAGGEPRGTLYGVYTFLEDYCDCRWFTSTCSRIPSKESIIVPANLDLYIKPIFEYREIFYSDAFDGDWSARNKSNGKHSLLKEKHGGQVRYTDGWFVHTFSNMVSTKLYGEDHPEYFAMIDGERQNKREHAQLCLTNPEVLELCKESALKALRADPTSTIISISQNDGDSPCQCVDCQAIVQEEGSESGPILQFVNAVAEAIEQEFPLTEVDTLAYDYSRKPPLVTKPRGNVLIRLCSFECCFTHPFNECRQISDAKRENTPAIFADFAGDVEAWSKLTDRLYIWDYISNFELSTLPIPNLQVLAPNVQFFSENSVKGVFSQGTYYKGNAGEMAELRAYLMAKLLWNPHYDVEQGKREFLEGWFGPAAEPIGKYLDMMRDATLSLNCHISEFDGPISPYLSSDILDKADLLFDEAVAQVNNMPELYARVLKERLCIRFPRFFQSAPEQDQLEREEKVEAFMRDAAALEIYQFSEKWSKFEHIRRMLMEGVWPPQFSPRVKAR